MSQFVKVLQHNGGFISLLADDDGVIQYTTNDSDFDGIVAGETTNAVHADTADLADVATLATTATTATTAAGPTVATTFLNTLQAAQDTITTLVAPGNDLDVTGLVGDTDGDYEISGVLTLTGHASANEITMQPNSLTTNQSTGVIYAVTAGAAFLTSALLYAGFATNTANSTFVINGKFTSKKGRARIWSCVTQGIMTDASAVSSSSVGQWNGTATDLTSMRFNATHGLEAGSFIRVRKLRNLT